jgi:hypothetical protein
MSQGFRDAAQETTGGYLFRDYFPFLPMKSRSYFSNNFTVNIVRVEFVGDLPSYFRCSAS